MHSILSASGFVFPIQRQWPLPNSLVRLFDSLGRLSALLSLPDGISLGPEQVENVTDSI
jgi:hypothetical protein